MRFLCELLNSGGYNLSIKFAMDPNKWKINCVGEVLSSSHIASLLKGAQLH